MVMWNPGRSGCHVWEVKLAHPADRKGAKLSLGGGSAADNNRGEACTKW
jgi:hypothetical protein